MRRQNLRNHYNNFMAHLFVLILLFAPQFLFAQTFVPLSPELPLADENIWDASVSEMLNALLLILISIGGVLGVLLFAVSGIQYMATESVSKKGIMKEGMTRVIIGLFLILSSVLILGTINRDIINIDLFERAKTQTTQQNIPNTAPARNETGGLLAMVLKQGEDSDHKNIRV